MRLLLVGLLFAGILVGCGEKQEESIAPDAAALKAAAEKPQAPKGTEAGGGMPPPSSAPDPTK